jgi:hypothetical protein
MVHIAWKEALAAGERHDGASASMEDLHAADIGEDAPHEDMEDRDDGAMEEHAHTVNVGEVGDKDHDQHGNGNVEGPPDTEVASTDLDCCCSGQGDEKDVP